MVCLKTGIKSQGFFIDKEGEWVYDSNGIGNIMLNFFTHEPIHLYYLNDIYFNTLMQ